jgi:hypothetical protein
MNSESQGSEGMPNVAQKFHGLEDENDDLNEFGSILGKRGPTMVCCSTLTAAYTNLYMFAPSFQLGVKVEDANMPPTKKQGGCSEGGKCHTKFTNCNLPQGSHDSNNWCRKFIPTYEKWLGTRTEPWIIDKNENVATLQTIWNAVYPHVDHIVDIDGPVYHIVSCIFPFYLLYHIDH